MCNEKVIVQFVEDNQVTLPRAEYDILRNKAFAMDSILLHASNHAYLSDDVIRAIIGVFLAPLDVSGAKDNQNSSTGDVTPRE